MNKTLKQLMNTEYKRLLTLFIVFIACLILSALIYIFQGNSVKTTYDIIKELSFLNIFVKVLRKNILYFISIALITCIGLSKIIYLLFGIITTYYGLSIIYLIKIMQSDRLFFLFTVTEYFVLFPLIFYFTYISSIISKYTRKSKNIETISRKFDIIVSSYIKLSFIYLLIIIAYSFIYSIYIIILGRLLVM